MQKLHTKNISGGGKWFFAAVLSLLSVSAFAQISIPGMNYHVEAGEPSITLLGRIFGGAISAIPGDESLMGAAMQVFNSAILSIAALIGFYIVVSAVIATAKDGEVLGKRFSSFWAPVRVIAAVAMMVPAAGGYSGVQLLVLTITAHGVGLANQITTAGYKIVFEQKGFSKYSPPPVSSAEALGLAKELLPIAACMTANEYFVLNAGMKLGDEIKPFSQRTVSRFVGQGSTTNIGFNVGERQSVHSCGSFKIPSKWGNAIWSTDWAAENAVSIEIAQIVAVTELYREIKVAVNSTLDETSKIIYGDALKQATLNYDKNLRAEINTVAKIAVEQTAADSKKGLEALVKEGWTGLGKSYLILAKIGANLPKVLETKTVAIESTPIAVLAIERDIIFATFNKIINIANNSAGTDTPDGSQVLDESAPPSSNNGSVWGDWVGGSDALTLNLVESFVSEPGANPLLDMKQRGDVMITSAVTSMAVASGVAIKLGIGSLGFSNGFISGAMSIATLFSAGIIALGLTLSVYIPMIPYIIWFLVILAWLIAVVEAVVAAPLWMLTHIAGEEEGIATQSSVAGYKFVAAVFLRPALSVISFFAASLIVLGLGDWLNMTFGLMVREVQSSSASGLIVMFGFIGIYTGMCATLINRCFSLTLTLPSNILKWFGASLNGDDGNDSEVKDHAKVLGGAIVSTSQGATGSKDPKSPTDNRPPINKDTGAGPANTANKKGGELIKD